MMKKGKIFLLAAALVLAFAQVALPALTAVGPTNAQNGFPLWYRDASGQTVTLSVPPNAVSIPDPVIPGNAFSQQIGFGSEAMYWHSTADMVVGGGGQGLLVMALEAAFAGGDAAPGDQIVFARMRFRIDIVTPGTYVVTHPFGTRTFEVAAGGIRAINDTMDVGIGAPGDFTGALSGEIGPFLVSANAIPGVTLGDGATPATVTGSPTGNNFFQVSGPDGTFQTDQFITGAELFQGTPFTIKRTTFSRTLAGAATAEVFVNTPAPFVPGTRILARLLGAGGFQLLQRNGSNYFGRFALPNPFNPNLLRVRGTINGSNATVLPAKLVDVVTVPVATYNVTTQTLSITAVSSDALATLTGTGWAGAGAGQPLVQGVATDFSSQIAPATITVTSSSDGTVTVQPVIVE